MKVLVRDRRVEVTQALRMHIERRIGLGLGRFADRIAHVTAVFSIAGADTRCQIEVSLRPPRVRVEGSDADPFAAADYATDRASSSVARALERERILTADPLPAKPGRRGR